MISMSDAFFSVDAVRGANLRPVSFTLRPGEILMVQGESGVGKSQLLRALADLDAHEGKVVLNGVEQQQMPPSQWRRRVVYLPAESAWWDDYVDQHFTENLPETWWAALRLKPELFRAEVARLSSGERQRLAVARALVLKPKVLLLDEPTANLDAVTAKAVGELLSEQIKAQGSAGVWVTHDASEAARFADKQLYLDAEGGHIT
ncbi:MAG TPA: ATP-binding cassette domain-containing protein [Halothiobacillaceae bacterium]|nr:ATP-binding cassette domain-containing protein [Halothiobacillaceae bacterium]